MIPAQVPRKAHPQDRFGAERTVHGGITILNLRGTLNQAFEGKKIANLVRNSKLVIGMRDVRRFASWGMSEWMDFLRINSHRDIYLVECSTYAVSQLNLVTGLLGHCKLVSFYAAYGCTHCGEISDTVFVVPRDRELIRELPGSEQPCPKCGGASRLEEYPASFFDRIADRPGFDIDDEVLALFQGLFRYDLAPDLTRFRAQRATQGEYTYIRLSGNLDTMQVDKLVEASRGTTVVDLERAVFDPTRIAAWRAYMQAAPARTKAIHLLHCPPKFLENAVTGEDLRGQVKVRTFALPYDCLRCETTTVRMVDVADTLEYLVEGTAPPALCAACGSMLVAILSTAQTARLRELPARDRDAVLDKFLDKARTEPADKLENVLTLPPAEAAREARRGRPGLGIVLGLIVVMLLGLTALTYALWQREDGRSAAAPAQDAGPSRPVFTRPDWILSDVPASAYCHDMINRLMCVGVSSYRATRDEAVAEANDAALEELVHGVGMKIDDVFFRDNILPSYGEVRGKALAALDANDIDRAGAAYVKALDTVRAARRRVVDAFLASGGAAVPSQRSDWYWEEYAGENGKPNEYLVFVRYDVAHDSMRALVERYTATSSTDGTVATTAFPGLGWQHGDYTGGVILHEVGRGLRKGGIAAGDLVVSVGDVRVSDAVAFARRVEELAKARGKVQMVVKTGADPTRPVEVKP